MTIEHRVAPSNHVQRDHDVAGVSDQRGVSAMPRLMHNATTGAYEWSIWIAVTIHETCQLVS
jgi:hypothetical protein